MASCSALRCMARACLALLRSAMGFLSALLNGGFRAVVVSTRLNMVNSDLCLSRSWHRKAFCFSVLV